MADPFSCDLVQQSKLHITFLRSLHKGGVTLSKPSLESFHRYSQLWLPLVYHHAIQQNANGVEFNEKKCSLVPPADIAWLWHCHRLAPYRYANYVKNTFFSTTATSESSFQVLDACHPFAFQFQGDNDDNEAFDRDLHGDASKYTMELFQELYPNESFFLNLNLNLNSTGNSDGKRKNRPASTADSCLAGFDVIESCDRQASFLWQVSGAKFRDEAFLRQGIENYTKFVSLMGTTSTNETNSPSDENRKQRPQFIVPTYQIDLMWHTHMLTSIAKYHEDNLRMNGCTLEHDDSLNDRTEGGKLDTNFQATRKLWSDIYGVEYKVPGGMYRGEPPESFFKSDWPERYLNGDKAASQPSMLDGLSLAHLIGQIGASSVGRATWLSIDSPEAFQPPNERSKTKGENANGPMEGYVFGKGGK